MPGLPVRLAVLALGFLALFGPPARAQEPGGDAEPRLELEYQGSLQVHRQDDGEALITVSTSVRVRGSAITIFCDHLVLWSREKSPMPGAEGFRLTEFYAEGHVRLESRGQVFEAERIYVDFSDRDRRTLLVDRGRLDSQSKKKGLPLHLTAAEFRQLAGGDVVGKDVSVTTCEFAVPDYRLQAREVVIHEDWRSGDIEVFGAALYIDPLDFPVFWTPVVPVQLGAHLPLRRLKYEKTRQMGHSVLSKWGYDLRRMLIEGDGSRNRERWAYVGIDLDWREKRGVGFGPEYDYELDGMTGFGDLYYIHDEANVPGSDFQDRLVPVEREERGRVRLFHRQQLWEPLSFDLELHDVSDPNFREEFLEKEFKSDKSPESYALVRFMRDNFGMTALYRPRLDAFFSYVEYLPQVTQSLLSEGLPLGFYLTHNAQAANVRFLKDRNQPGLDQYRTVRTDIQETVSRPFSVGPVRFLPFAAGRWTYWDEGYDDPWWTNRYAAAVGGSARLSAWRVFPWKLEEIGIDGVRHTTSLEGRYVRQYSSTSPADVPQFDAVDQVREFQEITLEWRNRLEARDPESGEIYDAVNFGVTVEFYPDAHRDTRSRTSQNFLYPQHWITLAPDRRGAYPSRNVSNVHFDLELRARSAFELRATLDLNPYTGRIEETHMRLEFRPTPTLAISLGQQYVTEVTHTVGAGFEWAVSEKWTLLGRTEYDFRGERALEHRYAVRRDMHDFDVELEVRYDDGRDEFSASVGLIPHRKGRAEAGGR
ncbi:MAG: LPS assembly protein LptD [Candidatus Brocadiae bacterium]|nr:LPS assembly protein LptD [Candidatus Brocadiia bacterium]